MAEHSPTHRLTRHSKGWVKKIRGKVVWICSLAQAPAGADADAIYEKRMAELWSEPMPAFPRCGERMALRDIADEFRSYKQRATIAGRSLREYEEAIQDFLSIIGSSRLPGDLMPADFAKVRQAWAKRFGPHRLRKFIMLAKAMFNWAARRPLQIPLPDYGDEFRVPSKREFRLSAKASREAHGSKFFTPEEIRTLIGMASSALQAMILLAINGGLGNTDLASLPVGVVDLGSGWLDYARAKTGVDRRIPLWPETIKALAAEAEKRARWQASRVKRGRPKRDGTDHLFFLTRMGLPFIIERTTESGGVVRKDQISQRFEALCRKCGLARKGRGFYSLRRTFRTMADEFGDARAAALMMGHEVDDVSSVYVLHVSDERLLALSNRIRGLIFSGKTARLAKSSAPAGAAKAAGGSTALKESGQPSRDRSARRSRSSRRESASPESGG